MKDLIPNNPREKKGILSFQEEKIAELKKKKATHTTPFQPSFKMEFDEKGECSYSN